MLLETLNVDSSDLRVVDHDGTELRCYHGRRVIAEKVRGTWFDTAGGRFDAASVELLDSLPVAERVRVRDGTKKLPPGSYWDPDLGHYVSRDDEEWSQKRYDEVVRKRKARPGDSL